ncbi:MAG: DNA glycosylase [Chthoniobacterales bacterium]
MNDAKAVFLSAPVFQLDATLESGQVFHWERSGGGGWSGLVDREALHVEPADGGLCVNRGGEEIARRYFALDHPLDEIFATFPKDAYTQAAVGACRGLRIIRQPKWECLATFITSSMKQVAHIRTISLTLRDRYGERVVGSKVRAYPSAARLARCDEGELRGCGLGYRAKTLLATAKMIDEGVVDLELIGRLPTPELLATLTGLPGVGIKVANCVALFAYERLEAVPIDVWIARVLTAMHGGDAKPRDLEAFCRDRLGPFAGYVQQYLFHHARISKTLPSA